jgi:hypothetical protein
MYNWKYGENEYQKYYGVTVNGEYLCVFANNWEPDIWLGSYRSITIHNKTVNDRQRKKQGLPKGCPSHLLHHDRMLTSNSPEYMMKKVEYCFKHGLTEISQ